MGETPTTSDPRPQSGAMLRALLVEDRDDDAQLIVRELRRGGFDPAFHVVASRDALQKELESNEWDVVVSDYTMPAFSAREALELVRARDPDLPFIVASGAIAEEEAIGLMRAGASDYLLKDSLGRLCPAIARDLRDADARRAKRRAEQKAREAEQRIRSLIEQIPAVTYLATADAKRAMLYVSPQIEALTGEPAPAWTDPAERWWSRIHPDDRARVEAELRQSREQRTRFVSEYRLHCAAGRCAWVRDEATIVHEDGNAFLRGFVVDITRVRKSEEAVERLAYKDSVVSIVSHELRTPLSSLVGFTELMLSREFPPDKRHELLSVIHSEAVRLSALIDDFLDVQRMEAGRCIYSLAPLDVAPLLEATGALLLAQSPPSRIALRIEPGLPRVAADASRLRQVFTNLLSNALKFSDESTEVTVSARTMGDAIEIAITDRGVGIPADALPHLFTKFFRADNDATRRVGGTGLGLAIVKEIVQAHRGRVAVESRLGEGTTVRVSLPVAVNDRTRTDAAQPALAAVGERVGGAV